MLLLLQVGQLGCQFCCGAGVTGGSPLRSADAAAALCDNAQVNERGVGHKRALMSSTTRLYMVVCGCLAGADGQAMHPGQHHSGSPASELRYATYYNATHANAPHCCPEFLRSPAPVTSPWPRCVERAAVSVCMCKERTI
jgi:hypothetical protein